VELSTIESSTESSGSIQIFSGSSGSSTGSVVIGTGMSATNNAGVIYLAGGLSSSKGASSDILLQAGSSNGINSTGGNVQLLSGDGTIGGSVLIRSGNGILSSGGGHISVEGVGAGSRSCTQEGTVPIALSTGEHAHYRAPIVSNSQIPALLGLESLESRRTILDLVCADLRRCDRYAKC
jgi:hypothetical protein